jgi:hypothetical protein
MSERAHGNKRHRIFDGTKTQKKVKKTPKILDIPEIDDGINRK